LILNTHLTKYGKDNILQTILDFVSHIDRECSEVKISINARARLVATEFLKAF
jgi:actin related protein 2/3 complex subunit 4